VAELGQLRSWEAARWIGWGDDLRSTPAARWLEQHVKSAPALRTSHFPSQLAAAHAGLGALLVPGGYTTAKTLRSVPLTPALTREAEDLPSDDLWLVGHRALRGVPRVAAVWQFLVDEIAAFARACPAALPLSSTSPAHPLRSRSASPGL
jgi:DNA-binding transcriptional LysR family regulator